MTRFLLVVLVTSLAGCAAKAQARSEAELPQLDPPPPPPRVVAIYPDEFVPAAPLVEPAVPSRPPARAPRQEAKPEPPPATPEPVPETTPPAPPVSLTLTPSPGTETQTAAAIRDLLTRTARDLSRVNASTLTAEGRAQFETARRFLEQAEDALKARNVVFAGKLADKAATMAAVLVR